MKKEKVVSFRLTDEVFNILKCIATDDKKITNIVEENFNIGLKLSQNRDVVALYNLLTNPKSTMATIIKKYYDAPETITTIEIQFMIGQIRMFFECSGALFSKERYQTVLNCLEDTSKFLLERKSLPSENHCKFIDEHIPAPDIDKYCPTGALEYLDTFTRKIDHACDGDYRDMIKPYMATIVKLASVACLSKDPLKMAEFKAYFPYHYSRTETFNDFTITLHHSSEYFSCVLDMPSVRLTLRYQDFVNLSNMTGLLPSHHDNRNLVQLNPDVRFSLTDEEVAGLKTACWNIRKDVSFAIQDKLLALIHGVE